MATSTHTTVPGMSPAMARLFVYAEPIRPARGWMRAALLTLAAMLAVNPS